MRLGTNEVGTSGVRFRRVTLKKRTGNMNHLRAL